MIKIVPDLGAPAAVVAVDLLTLEYQPTWNEVASYVMAGVGYVLAGFGLVRGSTGEFLTKMSIAAVPLAARSIRHRIAGTSPVTRRAGAGASRLAFRTASAPAGAVSRQYQPEFEGAGAHAI